MAIEKRGIKFKYHLFADSKLVESGVESLVVLLYYNCGAIKTKSFYKVS